MIVDASPLAINPDAHSPVLDALKAFQKNSDTANEYFFEPFGGAIEGAIRNGLGEAAPSEIVEKYS